MFFERLDILERLHSIEKEVVMNVPKRLKPEPQIVLNFFILLNQRGIPCRVISIFWKDPALKAIMGEATILGVSEDRIHWAARQLKDYFGRDVLLIDIFERVKALPIWLKPPAERGEQDKFEYLCNLYSAESGHIVNADYLRRVTFEAYGIDPQKGNIFYFPSYFHGRVFFDAMFALEKSPEGWEMLFTERLLTAFVNVLHLNCRIYLHYISALRSAIAAIMGRNMSHNIGSHSIWHLAEQLKNSEIYSNPDIERFLRYLQKRMDFIAQVSTSAPSWCLTMKWGEIVKGFEDQGCLLDNIAWSHKVRYCDNWFEGKAVPEEHKPEVRLTIVKQVPRKSENGTEKEVELSVDIPHGQIGAQAFYTILENLIRNTAKYGDRSPAPTLDSSSEFKKLEFTIKIEDDWMDGGKGWREDYYRVSIRDNWATRGAVVTQLNDSLAAPIIDPATAELKAGNWGMKEIKICAAYLRMVRPEEIDAKYEAWKDGKDDKEPPMIEVKLTNDDWQEVQQEGHLTYVLYMLRPKEALLVGEELKRAAETSSTLKEGA